MEQIPKQAMIASYLFYIDKDDSSSGLMLPLLKLNNAKKYEYGENGYKIEGRRYADEKVSAIAIKGYGEEYPDEMVFYFIKCIEKDNYIQIMLSGGDGYSSEDEEYISQIEYAMKNFV